MGMDINGLKPKEHVKKSEFKTLSYYEDKSWRQRQDELNADQELHDKYWDEWNEYRAVNKGVYFRNACARWRGLWDFCYFVGRLKGSEFDKERDLPTDLISKELWHEGHHNSGAGLDQISSIKLADLLQRAADKGILSHYAEQWEQTVNVDENGYLPPKEKWFYEFDTDNVFRFIKFLRECGGFEIC